jgi:hypothetical protein
MAGDKGVIGSSKTVVQVIVPKRKNKKFKLWVDQRRNIILYETIELWIISFPCSAWQKSSNSISLAVFKGL